MDKKLYLVVLDWDDPEERYYRYVVARNAFAAVAYFVHYELTVVGTRTEMDAFSSISTVQVIANGKNVAKLLNLTEEGIFEPDSEYKEKLVQWFNSVMFSIGGSYLEPPMIEEANLA